MTSIDKLITIASAEIGTTESPANSNKQKYGLAYGMNGVFWCVIFIWWCFKQSGLSQYFYGGGKTASCSELVAYHKKKGQVITSGYQRGDLILFNFSKGTAPQHIGLCLSYDGKTITTIDGNTGTTSEDNGGAVMKRTRILSEKCKIICGIRWYDIVTTTSNVDISLPVIQNGIAGNYVKNLQILLNAKGFTCGTVDGSCGAKTITAIKKFQTAKGLTSDGIVGKDTWTKLLKG
jgi:hypothetical protein